MLANSFSAIMKQDIQNPLPVMFTNILRLFVMALPMYIAVKWPDKISIIGVGIGMVIFLPALIINEVKKEEKQ